MKNIIILIALITFVISSKAQGFEPFVIIDPPNPMVGDTIQIGVAHTFHPPCLTLPATNFQGLSHLFEFSGNDIRLTAVNDTFIIPICFPFPVIPAPRAYYELGQLPEGNYNLVTWIGGTTSPLPIPITVPPTFFPLIYGPTLTFEVRAAAVAIDTLSASWLVLYGFLLLLTTYLITKKLNLHSK